jgi:hypothetical protein
MLLLVDCDAERNKEKSQDGKLLYSVGEGNGVQSVYWPG